MSKNFIRIINSHFSWDVPPFIRGMFSPFMLSAVILIIFLWALTKTWLNVDFLRLQHEIAREHKTQQMLFELNRKFKLEMANLKAPKNLGKIGVLKYELQFPEQDQIMVFRDVKE